MEQILIHWDDIVELLLDELLKEEVVEMNKIEAGNLSRPPKIINKPALGDKAKLDFKSYRSVDLRDIMKVFEDYLHEESQVTRKARVLH